MPRRASSGSPMPPVQHPPVLVGRGEDNLVEHRLDRCPPHRLEIATGEARGQAEFLGPAGSWRGPPSEPGPTVTARPVQAMRICCLGSGSSGNAVLVEALRTLARAGGRRFQRPGPRVPLRRTVGVDPRQLSAIIITHDHGDHTRGVGRLRAAPRHARPPDRADVQGLPRALPRRGAHDRSTRSPNPSR